MVLILKSSKTAIQILAELIFVGVCGLFVNCGHSFGQDSSKADRGNRGFLRRTFLDDTGVEHRYVIFLPHGYQPGSRPPPVLMFLNGVGENGEDGIRQISKNFGVPVWESREFFPFLAIAPQCRTNGSWAIGSLDNQLNIGKKTLHENLATPEGLTALTTPLSAFRCTADTGPALNNFDESLAENPSDPEAPWYNRHVTSNGTDRIAIATSNYIMVACSSISTTTIVKFDFYGPATGVGSQNSFVKLSDVTDGASNTFLIGERCFRFGNLNVGSANALGFSSQVNTQGSNSGIKTAGMCVLGTPHNGINWTLDIRHRNRSHGSHLGRFRWPIERTISWIKGLRRMRIRRFGPSSVDLT